MRPIDADRLEKTLGDWIREHWTEAFTGDDAGSEFADMIDHAETIVPYCPNCDARMDASDKSRQAMSDKSSDKR